MNKTITIAAYNRPGNLRLLTDSLFDQQASFDDWKLHIRIDAGGDKLDQVWAVAEEVGFVDTRIHRAKENEGINSNTYWLMSHVFDHEQADYNLYLEDDLVLSPDALNVANWYIENEAHLLATPDLDDIGALCLCKLHDMGRDSLTDLFFSRAFVGWGFLMSKRQWWAYGNPAWTTADALWGRPMMWDNSVANYIRERGGRIYNLFPTCSRVTNTGREGVHFTPEKYDKRMTGHVYQQEHKVFDYQWGGWASEPQARS